MNVDVLELTKKDDSSFTIVVAWGGSKKELSVTNKNDLIAQLTKMRECESDYKVLNELVGTTITV